MLIQKSYDEIRDSMLPGDVLAFGGRSRASRLIKFGTQTGVTHVAMVYAIDLLIESTTLADKAGVFKRGIGEVTDSYAGEVWWLPLASAVRSQVSLDVLTGWLDAQEGKPYDFAQAGLSALDVIDNAFMDALKRESFRKLFCSELACGALKNSGVKKLEDVNASDVTPIDLCRFDLYSEHYCQLKGAPKEIRGHRSIIPERWGG